MPTKPRSTARKLSTDALTSDNIAQLNNEKADRQAAATATKAVDAAEDPAPIEKTATITQSQFDKLMGAMAANADAAAKVPTLEKELADAKALLEAKESEIAAQKELAAADSAKKDSDLNFLNNLFATMGYEPPTADRYNPNTLATDAKMDAATALREWDSACASAKKHYWTDRNGDSHLAIDNSSIDRFVREHRDEMQRGAETLAKKVGLLQGRGSDAPTVKADIPPAYLIYLSALIRLTHSPRFIYHQFCNLRLEVGKGMGDTMLIPRAAYGNTSNNIADWQLTPGTPLVASSQPVLMSSVQATLLEQGMGKNATMEPIAIPEFVSANSQMELDRIVQRNLGYNYNQYEEINSRSLWFGTTKTAYNNGGTVVQTPAAVSATAATAKYRSGALSYQFLINLYAFLSGLQIPQYENGCYGLVLHENALAQLKSSLAERNTYFNSGDINDITNLFRTATMSDVDKISGYQGTIANFMIFATNNNSLGAAGTIGAQTETVGGVAQITRTSFAFGADSIARGVGMPATIRQQLDVDFGRLGRWSWISHEAWAQLDVDAIFPGQQTRVFKINTTDQEV